MIFPAPEEAAKSLEARGLDLEKYAKEVKEQARIRASNHRVYQACYCGDCDYCDALKFNR